MARRKLDEFADVGLSSISDNLILKDRKPTDTGLILLIAEYEKITTKHSSYKDLTDEMTGYQLKELISKLPFDEKIVLVYKYLVEIGKIIDDKKEIQEFKKFGFRFAKWALVIGCAFFLIAATGIITVGVVRNDIDSNAFISLLMSVINKLIEVFFGTPNVGE